MAGGLIRAAEAYYATPAAGERRRILIDAIGPRPGEHSLDLAAGGGLVIADLAARIGDRGRVIGLEADPDLIDLARARIERLGLAEWIEIHAADPVPVPLPAAACSIVVANQVLGDLADPGTALAEAIRVLRPSGRLAVVETDWATLVWPADDRARADRILRAALAGTPHPNLPPELPARLGRAGFEIELIRPVPIVETRLDTACLGHWLIAAIADRLSDHPDLPATDVAAWQADLRGRAGRGEAWFSLTTYLFLARRPA